MIIYIYVSDPPAAHQHLTQPGCAEEYLEFCSIFHMFNLSEGILVYHVTINTEQYLFFEVDVLQILFVDQTVSSSAATSFVCLFVFGSSKHSFAECLDTFSVFNSLQTHHTRM